MRVRYGFTLEERHCSGCKSVYWTMTSSSQKWCCFNCWEFYGGGTRKMARRGHYSRKTKKKKVEKKDDDNDKTDSSFIS